MTPPQKRLIVLYDGTWNDPQDQTNVYRLARSIDDFAGAVPQQFFYDEGVGTAPFTRLRGGLYGYGLSANLMQGYDWLARRYAAGDEIWIFGFSRGAYTARSLAGLLRKCGLLHIVTDDLLDAAETLYRNRDIAPDAPEARQFRRHYSREVRVHFLGVWDTVGALGGPGPALGEKYKWHDTRLSKIVDRAYHAMALDEHRAPYDILPWTNPDGQPKPENLDIEQRWFIGAHADVGGGYGGNSLTDIALAWLLEKAAAAGLQCQPVAPGDYAHLGEIHDSYADFMGGAYAAWRQIAHPLEERHHRRYDADKHGNRAVNVTVDASVWRRWSTDPEYRPPTLARAGFAPFGL